MSYTTSAASVLQSTLVTQKEYILSDESNTNAFVKRYQDASKNKGIQLTKSINNKFRQYAINTIQHGFIYNAIII